MQLAVLSEYLPQYPITTLYTVPSILLPSRCRNFLSKGSQVAPAKLRNLPFTQLSIREAAVVGVPAPDDPGTDLPRAYAAPVEVSVLSEGEIEAWVAERAAPYKLLMVFEDEIPNNTTAKMPRRELREKAKKEMAEVRPQL